MTCSTVEPALQTTPPPVTWREFAGFFAMGVGMFMAMLDVHIVASSLPQIQAGVFAAPDEISWIQTSYLIAEVVMIPLSGLLARILSTRVVFTASAVGFTVMSAACAAADSIETMIVFRALQGFSGGAMIPLVFSTAFTLFPGPRQTFVSAVTGMIVTLAPTLGPSVGGYITEHSAWQWLFLANLLPGCVVASTVWLLIRVDEADLSLARSIDGPGLILMTAWLGSMLYVLEEGPANGWLDDSSVTALFWVCVMSGILFFWRVFSTAKPIVDLAVFSERNFVLGALCNFSLGVGLWGALFLMPLFLSWVRAYNSLQIGFVMIVTGCFMFFSGPVAGFAATRMDRRVVLTIGLSALAAGIYLNSFLTSESSFWELALPQALRGISVMFVLIPANALALGSQAPSRLKNASGLYQLVHSLGGAISVAAINGSLITSMAFRESALATHVNLARPIVDVRLDELAGNFSHVGHDGLTAMVLRVVTDTIQREATVLALNDVLAVLAVGVGLILLMVPFVPRGSVSQ